MASMSKTVTSIMIEEQDSFGMLTTFGGQRRSTIAELTGCPYYLHMVLLLT